MKFDPATLLTTAFLTLLLFGLVLAVLLSRSRQDSGGVWWISAFLLGAAGFLVLLLVPAGPGGLSLVVANTLFLSAYGFCDAGARALAGRRPYGWSLAFAIAVWPLLCWLLDPGFGARIVISSLLICAYSAAAAFELGHGAVREERNRFIAAALCAGHALFYLVRALYGPTLGLVNAVTEEVVSDWGAIIALEVVLFAAAMAALIVGITLERAGLTERRAAYTDFLTGIGSRRAFEATMQAVLSAADRRVPTTLLLLDLDDFKKVNDRLGHHAGDELLQAFAAALRQQLSDPGLFWRIGGDEFAILLRGYKPLQAELMTEALRQTIATAPAIQSAGDGSQVSASIGRATLIPGDTMEDLVLRADAALYGEKRKRGGRNHVAFMGPQASCAA